MNENKQGRKSGLTKPVVLFFVFAVLCVVAFLIVILVKSCDAEHEEKVEEQQIEQTLGMTSSAEEYTNIG